MAGAAEMKESHQTFAESAPRIKDHKAMVLLGWKFLVEFKVGGIGARAARVSFWSAWSRRSVIDDTAPPVKMSC